MLAADWMPGMSTMPSFQSLVHVPFNGFAESKLHKPVSLVPCLHNFCAACCSDALQSGSRTCAICRDPIKEIRR